MRTFEWEEIRRHNHSDDCWLVYDGDVLDVSEWSRIHPGGSNPITSLAGEDASSLIRSSHLGDISHMIDRVKIGEVKDYEPHFDTDDAFLETLKKRVRSHLMSKGINLSTYREDHTQVLLTSGLLLSCWLIMYLFPPWGLLAAIPMGMATCSLIGAFGHEKIHGNLLPNLCNTLSGRISNNLLWGVLIPFMPERYFQYEHLKHHEQPMHAASDYDVYALAYFLRLSPDIEWRKHHRFQHIYAPLIYSVYIFIQVIAGYITPFFDQRAILKDRFGLFDVTMMKLSAITFHILLPVYLTDFVWVAICSTLYFCTWQACIYISSGVPHMTSGVKSNYRGETWSHYICRTTCSLKTGDRFFDWLCGGLNYHLEHHLLPQIPRSLLANISSIVRTTCEEFEYPCTKYDRFTNYYSDHYRFLKQLGTPSQDDNNLRLTEQTSG